MTDPVQQAREVSNRPQGHDPWQRAADLEAALDDLLAHVEGLEAERDRLIDPADLELLCVNGRDIEPQETGAWFLFPPDYDSSRPEEIREFPSAAEAVRAAREAES